MAAAYSGVHKTPHFGFVLALNLPWPLLPLGTLIEPLPLDQSAQRRGAADADVVQCGVAARDRPGGKGPPGRAPLRVVSEQLQQFQQEHRQQPGRGDDLVNGAEDGLRRELAGAARRGTWRVAVAGPPEQVLGRRYPVHRAGDARW